MNNKLIDYLEQKITQKYIKSNDEWTDIYITPLNRVDIIIVSDTADNIDSNEVRSFISSLISKFFNSKANQYNIGFLDIYSIDEADDIILKKPDDKKKRSPITWSDVVSLNKQLKRKMSNRSYRVICFYSYKGGVGRTTSLLQIAYTLAKQGKNLVLIDFDIEAPSFHLLFNKWIDDPAGGIEYGLVDYLYERMASIDPNEYKIKITDIFVPIKFDENLEGNIYVIPATAKLTNQYIFKLAQLQSNVIFENDYMEELLNDLALKLKFDTVFIDTRTGINQWGAFSMLGFAEQTMLIATPNQENVEGLTNIIELMHKAGLDNYVVAMSKYDMDIRGINLAKRYFNKLKGLEQEFTGIGYIPSVARTGKYPFVNILEPYKALSDYILESEVVKFNAKFLGKIDVVSILKQIQGCLDFVSSENTNSIDGKQDRNYYLTISNAERKILTNSNINIIVDNTEGGTKRISKLFKLFAKEERKRTIYPIDSDIGDNHVAYKYLLPIYDKDYYINAKEQFEGKEDLTKQWLGYLLYLLNKNLEDRDLKTRQEKIQGFSLLRGQSFNKYMEFVNSNDIDFILDTLRQSITGQVLLYDSQKKSKTEKNHAQDVVFCIFNPPFNSQINLANDTRDENINLKNLVGLIECIMLCKKHIPEIRIVFLINDDFYRKYQNELDGMKGNLLEIEWKQEDVDNLMTRLLNPNLFRAYADAILKNKDVFGETRESERFCLSRYSEKDISEEQLYNKDIEELVDSCEFRQKILDLFWGIRLNSKRYSKTMISWFYEELKQTNRANSGAIIQVLNNTIEYEINKRESASDANKNPEDRMVNIESLMEGLQE